MTAGPAIGAERTSTVELQGASLPSIGVVIPTHDRVELLTRAVDSVLAQDYPGHLEIVIVHDRSTPDTSRLRAGRRPVRVIGNGRTSGLAGARNTGVLALQTDLVAFCDDDDWWQPGKLRAQVDRFLISGRPHLVTCAIAVEYDGRRSVRLAGTDQVRLAHLTRSRMSMLHSSTLLFDRRALVDRVGLVSESVPGSQNEDWDLLLRAAAEGPIAHVDEPLTVVQWGRSSYYARAWESKVASLHWMLARHPEVVADRAGAARVYGQIAFGEAAQGNRREALRWARRTLTRDPRQWRAVAALLVATGVVGADRVLDVLHRFGRGV